MVRRYSHSAQGTFFILGAFFFAAHAENILFPAASRVVNVTLPPYNAKKDGSQAVDSIINRALDENCNKNRIIYLPNGTYLVSNTIRWSNCGNTTDISNYAKNTILQGQSRNGTIIKLAKRSARFGDPQNRAPVIYTGAAPATHFRNAIHNLTVVVDSGNPGASGIEFFANNQGAVTDVSIISTSGAGVAGLDCAHWCDNGPFLVKNVAIDGFNYGIWLDGEMASMTFENIELVNQRVYGIWNKEQPAFFHNLRSRNAVPVLYQSEVEAFTSIVGGRFEGIAGASSKAAVIIDTGGFFARDIKFIGYQKGVDNNVGTRQDFSGDSLVEFASHPPLSLFPSPGRTLRLPIKETPDVPWDDTGSWVSPAQFGAVAGDAVDDTRAFNQALAAGAATVYVPNGSYRITGSLTIGGSVRRIIGCEATLQWGGPDGTALFDCVDGAAPTVVIERFDINNWSSWTPSVVDSSLGRNTDGTWKTRKTDWKIRVAARRTFVFKHMTVGWMEIAGPGDLFTEDVVGGPIDIGANAKVWGRQFNVENSPKNFKYHQFHNAGGVLWVLGWKSEGNSLELWTSDGGFSEILGYFSYQSGLRGQSYPLVVNHESNVSIVMTEISMDTTVPSGPSAGRWYGPPAPILVVETRNGITDTLKRGQAYWHPNENNLADSTWASMMPLYAGYTTGWARTVRTSATPLEMPRRPHSLLLRRASPARIALEPHAQGAELFDSAGRLVCTITAGSLPTELARPYSTGVLFVKYLRNGELRRRHAASAQSYP